MLSPLIQRPRRSLPHRTRERGVTMALVALAMVGIIAMAGLSIDIGTLYQASAEAQRAADVGALAAARVISMEGVTGDPTNGAASGTWSDICGGTTSPATLAATAVIGQNPISGASSNPNVTVSYSYSGGSPSPDCSTLGGSAFGVNPLVTVLVQQTNLPTYFSRIWGRTGNTVSATATAEAFNPSNSGTYAGGTVIPVQPRCVKPWVVPNADPRHPVSCSGTNCSSFVNATTGQISNQGIFTNGGIIGERFFLQPDCATTGTTCTLLPGDNPPLANPGGITPILQYVPGQAPPVAPIAIPTNGSTCSAVVSNYAQAIAGCDQSTVYQCGVPAGSNNNYSVDLSENPTFPAPGDTQNAVQCLIHQTQPTTGNPSGQDILAPGGTTPPSYPFQILAGTSNPLLNAGFTGGNVITASTSIVSLPIYDISGNQTFTPTTTNVTIVGFLQVFINAVDTTNGMDVTVLNVSGCGNVVPNTTQALYGTSSVPVRLITPQ